MPENKSSLNPNPTTPAPNTGAGVNQEEDYEKIINDERFKEILEDCMTKCVKERECNNINCVRKCFYNACFKAAWVLYHVWYVDSSPTASTA